MSQVIAELDTQLSLSPQFLEDVYISYSNLVRSELEERALKLKQLTGQVLRIDHTYKVVQNISAFSTATKKRVMQIIVVCICRY